MLIQAHHHQQWMQKPPSNKLSNAAKWKRHVWYGPYPYQEDEYTETKEFMIYYLVADIIFKLIHHPIIGSISLSRGCLSWSRQGSLFVPNTLYPRTIIPILSNMFWK